MDKQISKEISTQIQNQDLEEELQSLITTKPDINSQLDSQQLKSKLKKFYKNEISSNLIEKVIRYKFLNNIQTACFKNILGSQKNILVNAPTGCGKTFLYEMSILSTFLFYSKFSKNCEKVKMVYIAPIKSLCHEMSNNWSQVFSELKVCELNSDNIFSLEEQNKEIETSDLIICTPEKFDFLVRKWKEKIEFFENLKLIMIDEIHLLDDEQRGPKIEGSLTRLMVLQKLKEGFNFRIVGASASFSNYREVAKWLQVPDSHLFAFGEEYRKVEICKMVNTYRKSKNPFLFDISLNKHLNHLIDCYSLGKPVMVFCSTQKSAQKAAEDIILHASPREFIIDERHLQELTSYSLMVTNSALKSCLINGVGFHNAGLDQSSRDVVEKLFKQCKLRVLCTTSTLAQGVNLPAYLVIIKGTYCYRGQGKGYQQYKKQEILQMVGRAGRPQFETHGQAIIMTEKSTALLYEDLTNEDIVLRSHYLTNFENDLNNELALGTIDSIEAAFQFVKSCFLYTKFEMNPKKLRQENGDIMEIEDYFKNIIEKTLRYLLELGLITEEYRKYKSGRVSKEIAKQCIDIKSLEPFLKLEKFKLDKNNKKSRKALKELDILELVSEAEEFGNLHSKLSERKELNELNKLTKYPLKKSAADAQRKARVLLLASAQKLPIKSWILKGQAKDCKLTGGRILKCVLAIMQEKGSLDELIATVDLMTSVKRSCSSSAYSSIFQQVKGISRFFAEKLVTFGIGNLMELLGQDPVFFNNLNNKNMKDKFGSKMVKNLNCLPKFKVFYSIKKGISDQHLLILKLLVENKCEHFYHQTLLLAISNKDNVIIQSQNIYLGFQNTKEFIIEVKVLKKFSPYSLFVSSTFYHEFKVLTRVNFTHFDKEIKALDLSHALKDDRSILESMKSGNERKIKKIKRSGNSKILDHFSKREIKEESKNSKAVDVLELEEFLRNEGYYQSEKKKKKVEKSKNTQKEKRKKSSIKKCEEKVYDFRSPLSFLDFSIKKKKIIDGKIVESENPTTAVKKNNPEENNESFRNNIKKIKQRKSYKIIRNLFE